MQRILLATVIAVSLLVTGCNTGKKGDGITLKFSLPKGVTYDYTVNMDMDMKSDAAGKPVSIRNEMAMGYRFGVVGDSAEWKKLKATVTRIAMNINSGGTNINYDSDNPADSSDAGKNLVAKVLSSLKGSEFGFTMNEKGEVGEVTGMDEVMQHATSSFDKQGAEIMARRMSNVFDEDNFRQNIQQSFAVYPDKPVKPGDDWTHPVTMNSKSMPMQMDNKYTLESVNGDIAVVKVNSKISSPPGSSGLDISGTMTGTTQYEITTGVPLNGDLDMNLNMTVSSNGQSVPMTTNIRMKITGKKS